MLNGYGWVLLRAAPPDAALAVELGDDVFDERTDQANHLLWSEFLAWMEANADPFRVWDFRERNNNDDEVLSFSVSRNHRASGVWAMFEWLAVAGPGSYGLFFAHDDEDDAANNNYGRAGADLSNCSRVHRLLHPRRGSHRSAASLRAGRSGGSLTIVEMAHLCGPNAA